MPATFCLIADLSPGTENKTYNTNIITYLSITASLLIIEALILKRQNQAYCKSSPSSTSTLLFLAASVSIQISR